MPRRTKAQIRKEARIAGILVGVLLLAVLTALMLTVPGFDDTVFRWLGIRRAVVPRPGSSESPVAVHFINVGQGDAVLLEENGEYALVDTGTPESTDDLLAYLRAAGVEKLRYVFMTHPHADHIGGMAAVVRHFEVALVVMPDFGPQGIPEGGVTKETPLPTSVLFENILSAMVEREVPAHTALIDDEFPLGQGLVRVVHAGLPSQDNYNLLSLGLMFEAEGMRYLSTGDGEKENELAMLESGQRLDTLVFMAGHHGSSTSNLQPFLARAQPGLVVVSCGRDNGYGHPHRSALAAYDYVGATVLRTDEEGNVVVQPDGAGGLVYATERGAEADVAPMEEVLPEAA